MYQYLKLLLIIILIIPIIHAEEIFVNTDALKIAHITLSEKYCKSIQAEQQLCKRKKLNYIDYEDVQIPTFLKNSKQYIAPLLKKYKDDDIKDSTLSDIKDFDTDISGDWYYENTIELFAKTPTTYTLSTVSSGYSGGAHGYHNMILDNYDIRTQTKLTLRELFLPDTNQTLHHIALAQYKQGKGLDPNQPLTDDGWFENKFLLAENFAITPRGIYFFYNQYEIKPYADGHTEFMLPYSKIREIINPKGILAFTHEKSNSL